jgi:hypothetical protein
VVTVPPIDVAQADRFLSLLGKQPATARLRAFPHRDNPNKWHPEYRPNGIKARKGPYDLAAASRWQQEGRGVYLVVNDGGDNDAQITACRAFFLEWDDRPVPWQLSAWQRYGLGEPTISITTGGKSAHLYWVLNEPIAPAEWIPIQAALIEITGADSTIRNPSRVMRLPGGSYIGAAGTALGMTTIYSAAGSRYSLEQVAQWVQPDEFADPLPESGPSAELQRLAQGDGFSGDLPPRPLETLRQALLKIPPFRHGTGQYQQLMKLAMRLHVDLGPAAAQQLLGETCCREIRDLPCYFQSTPKQISPGSTWAFLRETWGVDISRPDLKAKRPPPHRDATSEAVAAAPGKQASSAPLTLDQVRERLQRAVTDGSSRQDLEALVLELAGLADRSAYDLRNLLRTIEAEQNAAQAIASEVATIKAAQDRRDLSQALTLEWLCPPSLAAALRIRCSSLPADDVTALMCFLVAVSGVVKLGTQVVASEAASYRVPLNLYAALVARSGAKKTPVSRLLVLDPLRELRLDLARQNKRAYREWEEQNRGVKANERTPQPRAVHLLVSDFTAEALAEQLQLQEERGLGLLIHRDELAGMFGNLNAYRSGRGSDEEQLLEAYDGSGFSSLRITKAGGGRFYERCQLSICGTIQPAILEALVANGDASGLWARFLFIPLPERVVPLPEFETEQEQQEASWASQLLEKLCHFAYTQPRLTLALAPEARRYFVQYEARCQADVHRTTISAQGALIGKAAGKALRIAALLHLLHQGCTDGWHSQQVSVELMERACVLVDHINTWTMGLHQKVAEGANDLMRFIHRLATAHGSASWHDIAGGLSKAQRREIDSAAAAAAMEALAQLGVGVVERNKRGTPTYRATGDLP